MTQCSAHAAFEKMLQQSIDNLAKNICDGVAALNAQSAANGASIDRVLENQADRRELCGKQGARINSAEEDIRNLWKSTSGLRRFVYMAVGGLIVLQVIVTVGAAFAARWSLG